MDINNWIPKQSTTKPRLCRKMYFFFSKNTFQESNIGTWIVRSNGIGDSGIGIAEICVRKRYLAIREVRRTNVENTRLRDATIYLLQSRSNPRIWSGINGEQ